MTIRSTVNSMFVADSTAKLEAEQGTLETYYVRKSKLAEDRAAALADRANGAIDDDTVLARLTTLDAAERALDQLIANQELRVAAAQEAEDERRYQKEREAQRQIANTKVKALQQHHGELRRHAPKVLSHLAGLHQACIEMFDASNAARKVINPFDRDTDDAATAAITRDDIRDLINRAATAAGLGEFFPLRSIDSSNPIRPLADELGDKLETVVGRLKDDLGLGTSRPISDFTTGDEVPEPEFDEAALNRAEVELARMKRDAGKATLAPGERRGFSDEFGKAAFEIGQPSAFERDRGAV